MTCQIDVRCLDVSPGQRLAISGASPSLGSRDPLRAIPLTSSSHGLWSGAVPRQDLNAKFRLLILNADNTLAAYEPLKHSRKWPAEATVNGMHIRVKYGRKRMKVDKARASSWLDALNQLLACCLAPEQDSRMELDEVYQRAQAKEAKKSKEVMIAPPPAPAAVIPEPIKEAAREVVVPALVPAAATAKEAAPAWFLKPSVGTWYQTRLQRMTAPALPVTAVVKEAPGVLTKPFLLKPSVATWCLPLSPSAIKAGLATSCGLLVEAAEAVNSERSVSQWARLPSVATWAAIVKPAVGEAIKGKDFGDILGFADPAASECMDEPLGKQAAMDAPDLLQ